MFPRLFTSSKKMDALREKIDKIIPDNCDKKVILYGMGGMGVNALCLLKKFGKKVDYAVDGDMEKQGQLIWGIEVKSPYDLMYEDKENIIILVTAIMGMQEITKLLEGMGYIYNENYFLTFATELSAPFTYLDPVLSYSRGAEGEYEKVLFMGKREERKEERVILVLGGSTTDGTMYGIKSWPYYLQQKVGKKIQIYNGGIAGYTSSQELLGLLRDGFLKIKPDLVIDYSGINDATLDSYGLTLPYFCSIMEKLTECYKRDVGKVPEVYYGERAEKVHRYIMNIRMMRGVCQELGCEFISILQPVMWTCVDYKCNAIEQEYRRVPAIEQTGKKTLEFYSKVIEEIQKYDYIFDFSKIFNNMEDCFYESVHCNEKGNEIIADRIYGLLKEKKFVE